MTALELPGVVSADQACQAVQAVLADRLPALVEQLGRTDDFKQVSTWQQLPTPEALVSAVFPAAAITSPGLTGAPSYQRSSDSWTATWRIVIGIYDRGRDHNETAARVRDWCALIRTVLLLNRRLGGVVDGLTWVGEEYARLARKEVVRTLGAGAVLVDVTVKNAVDIGALTSSDLPLVLTTVPSLTVQPPG